VGAALAVAVGGGVAVWVAAGVGVAVGVAVGVGAAVAVGVGVGLSSGVGVGVNVAVGVGVGLSSGVGVGVGQITVSESEASPEPPLSVVKLAVLLEVAQLLLVVSLTTCAVVLVLPASVVGL